MHNQSLWREFFVTLELLQNQCVSCGRDLVAVMNEIRLSDGQGLPSRRQLYSQHRALSRALMDSELQCLRRKGQQTITRLQSLSKSISCRCDANTERRNDSTQTRTNSNQLRKSTAATNPCDHVTHHLDTVMAIFGEVDRAARRLEQLTEQRRERLREITRQQALEDEMNEVNSFDVLFRLPFLCVAVNERRFGQTPFSSTTTCEWSTKWQMKTNISAHFIVSLLPRREPLTNAKHLHWYIAPHNNLTFIRPSF